MPISLQCPGCKKPYQVQDQMAGKGVKCACGTAFVVPQPRFAGAPSRVAATVPAGPPVNSWLDEELAAYQQKQAAEAEARRTAEQAANPYAPPGMHGMPQQGGFPQHAGMTGGLWREGHLLVMDRNARLPPICVKSGQPASGYLTRKLSWQPAWVKAMYFILGWAIHWILVANYGKNATIEIGLSPDWFKRRMIFIVIGWVGALLSISVGGGALAIGAMTENEAVSGLGFFIGVIGLIISIVIAQAGASMVSADLITDRHVWVKGVCEQFLSQLPPWTGGRPH